MATFETRDSGYIQAKVRRKGWPAQSKTFRTKTEAEAWARAVEAEMDKGAFVSFNISERTTFKELAERFRQDFAPHHYRGAGWSFKLARLEDKLASYSLAAITPQLVARYRDERLKEPDPRYTKTTNPPRVSPATVKTEIDLLSKVFDVASKEFGISLPGGNPVKSVRKPKAAGGRDRRLTPKEWAALEKECKASQNPYLYPALLLSVETAMRQGELLSLKWEDVTLKKKLAMLYETKNGEARAVPLTSTALAVLQALPRDIGGLVIPQARMTIYHAFLNACKRAKIENFTWHDLRHEALSRLAERGDLSVLELAAVSGHKTLQMLKRYTHLQAEKLAQKLG